MSTICPLPTGMTVKASLTASETTRLASQNTFYGVNSMVNKTNPTQSNNKPNYTFNPPPVRLLGVIFWVAVALSSGLGYGFRQPADSKQHEQSAQTELYRFSRVEYEQLKTGMSLTEVRSILNPGVEVSRSATIATFVWENPDGSKITATFEHDKLKSKAQSRLK